VNWAPKFWGPVSLASELGPKIVGQVTLLFGAQLTVCPPTAIVLESGSLALPNSVVSTLQLKPEEAIALYFCMFTAIDRRG